MLPLTRGSLGETHIGTVGLLTIRSEVIFLPNCNLDMIVKMRGFIGIIGLGLFLLLSSSCSQPNNYVGSVPRDVAGLFGINATDAALHPAVAIAELFFTSRPSRPKETTPDGPRMHAWKKYKTDANDPNFR